MASKSTKNSDIQSNVVVLRSVYGKIGMKYLLQPCKNPETGEYPDCIRRVDSHGDMILSDKDKNSGNVFLPEDSVFTIVDGQTYNLDNPREKAIWESIKHNPLIAPERWAKNSKGEYLIDGTMDKKSTTPRYGTAELYVDRPGLESQQRVGKKSKYREALNYIFDDERGYEGRLTKARLLGRKMDNMPDTDVIDFLDQVAEKNPDQIINLYRGEDTSLRLLFADAKDQKVIIYKNKLYVYGDNIILGATDDAVINWMQHPQNKNILELIRKDVYPEVFADKKSK